MEHIGELRLADAFFMVGETKAKKMSALTGCHIYASL